MPITKYATQLVANLAKEPGYPADFAAAYATNIVSKEDNVAAVVAQDRARRRRRRDRLRHRRQGVDQGRARSTCPTGERAGDVRRRRRQGLAGPRTPPRRSSTGSPGPTARRSWPRFGFLPPVVIDDRRRGGGRRRPGERPSADRRWADRSSGVVAALVALFLGLPVLVLVGRAVARRRRLRDAAGARPVVIDALVLSLVTTSVSLVLTVVLGLPLAFVLARRHVPRPGARRDDRRPADRAAAVGRRLALLLVFGRRGLLGEPLRVLGI